MITAEGDAQTQLHAQASAIRDRVFQRSVVVRGVIEITNLCRVNCDYCPMRRDNTRQNTPFVLESDAIVAAARAVRDAGGRSEERRVGKECTVLCRSRWSPYH